MLTSKKQPLDILASDDVSAQRPIRLGCSTSQLHLLVF